MGWDRSRDSTQVKAVWDYLYLFCHAENTATGAAAAPVAAIEFSIKRKFTGVCKAASMVWGGCH